MTKFYRKGPLWQGSVPVLHECHCWGNLNFCFVEIWLNEQKSQATSKRLEKLEWLLEFLIPVWWNTKSSWKAFPLGNLPPSCPVPSLSPPRTLRVAACAKSAHSMGSFNSMTDRPQHKHTGLAEGQHHPKPASKALPKSYWLHSPAPTCSAARVTPLQTAPLMPSRWSNHTRPTPTGSQASRTLLPRLLPGLVLPLGVTKRHTVTSSTATAQHSPPRQSSTTNTTGSISSPTCKKRVSSPSHGEPTARGSVTMPAWKLGSALQARNVFERIQMCGRGSKGPGLVVGQPDLPTGWWLDLVLFSNTDNSMVLWLWFGD